MSVRVLPIWDGALVGVMIYRRGEMGEDEWIQNDGGLIDLTTTESRKKLPTG